MAQTEAQFAASLLRRLGIKPNRGNMQAMVGWERAEGGHFHNQARFNPLNTTQPEPGAGNTGSQGNIKVYRDWQQGLEATAKTLTNGRYQPIIQALKGNDPNAVANAIGRTPWGTSGSLVQRTIAGTKAPGDASGLSGSNGSTGVVSPATTRIPGQTIKTAVPTVDQAGFEQARKLSIVGGLIAKRNPNSFLLRSGLLSTAAPSLSDFTGSKTVTDTIPGATVIKPGSQIASGATADVAKVIERANVLNAKHHPYRWGGGHQARVANVNKVGPVDCSGAVSAVLGINPRVSGQFTGWGRPGDGGSKGITVAANSHHVLMKINGHWFGTSHSNPGGGAGWIPQSAISPQYLKGFTLRHSNG